MEPGICRGESKRVLGSRVEPDDISKHISIVGLHSMDRDIPGQPEVARGGDRVKSGRFPRLSSHGRETGTRDCRGLGTVLLRGCEPCGAWNLQGGQQREQGGGQPGKG